MSERQILALMYDLVLMAVCGYALARGGSPEELGAAVNLVASALSTVLRLRGLAAYAPGESFVFLIDIVVVASFYLLAIKTTRFWPVWAFGMALADILISAAGTLLRTPPLLAYYSALGIYAYLALAALAVGTFRMPAKASAQLRKGGRANGTLPT